MDYLKTLRHLFAFMKNTRLSETQMRELQNQKLREMCIRDRFDPSDYEYHRGRKGNHRRD